MKTKNFEILCLECFKAYSPSAFANRNGDIIYKRCPECRREYERKRKKIQRDIRKKQSSSQKPIYPDTLTRLRHYLLRHAGYMCQACGHDDKLNLKLINLDGVSMTDILNMYIDDMNRDNWNAVIMAYQRCILMCHECADTYNHDEAYAQMHNMYWKANPQPQPPD